MPDTPTTFGRRSPSPRRGGSATLRDRSSAYRKLRDAILSAEPLCRYCRAMGAIRPATILDHMRALSLSGTNDRSNLVPACSTCNDEKSLDERRFLARGYDPADWMLDPALRRWIERGKARLG